MNTIAPSFTQTIGLDLGLDMGTSLASLVEVSKSRDGQSLMAFGKSGSLIFQIMKIWLKSSNWQQEMTTSLPLKGGAGHYPVQILIILPNHSVMIKDCPVVSLVKDWPLSNHHRRQLGFQTKSEGCD